MKSLFLIGLVAGAWLGAQPALAQARADSAAAEGPETVAAPVEAGTATDARPAPASPGPGRDRAERLLVDLFEERLEAVPPLKPHLDYFIDEDGDGIGDGRLLRLAPAPPDAPHAHRIAPRLELLKRRREALRRKTPLRPPSKRPTRSAPLGRERR